MSRPRSHRTLQRLLAQLGEVLGAIDLVHAHEREWASATFAGARHSLTLRLPLGHGATADAVPTAALLSLPDHEFRLTGEIVADCTVRIDGSSRDERGGWWLSFAVELLTVDAD